MIRRNRPWGSGKSRGQALTEFALVIPLFLLILFAIVDMARFVYSSNALNEVAREAARQGTVGRRPVDCNGLGRVDCVKALVQNRVTAVSVASGNISVVCYRVPNDGTPPSDGAQSDNCGSTWHGGDLVRVTISTPFSLVTPFVGQFLAPTVGGTATWVTVNG